MNSTNVFIKNKNTFEALLKLSYREKLSYSTKTITVESEACELYQIPKEEIVEIINNIHPMQEKFIGDEIMYCACEMKKFHVTEFKVIWYKEANFIVSPYFFNSGATFLSCIKYVDGL